MSNVRCWNCGMDFEIGVSAAGENRTPPIQPMPDTGTMDEHDKFCPNIPCCCKPDDYGHDWMCSMACTCELINKVRNDERSKYV